MLILVLSCLVECNAIGESARNWLATWAAAPVSQARHEPVPQDGVTIRQIVHTTRGGSALRITFTNELGSEPLLIGQSSIYLQTAPTASRASVYPLSFGGKSSVTVPEGAVAISDPIDMQ